MGTAICTLQMDLIALFAANMYTSLDALQMGKLYLILRVKFFTTYDDRPRFFMLLRDTSDRDVLVQLLPACAGRFTSQQLELIREISFSIWCIGGGPGSSPCCKLKPAVF